jgi:hypothetical protein
MDWVDFLVQINDVHRTIVGNNPSVEEMHHPVEIYDTKGHQFRIVDIYGEANDRVLCIDIEQEPDPF